MFLRRLLEQPSLYATSALIEKVSEDRLAIRIGEIRISCTGREATIKDNKLLVDSNEVIANDTRIRAFQVLGENGNWEIVTEYDDKKELLKHALEGINEIFEDKKSSSPRLR